MISLRPEVIKILLAVQAHFSSGKIYNKKIANINSKYKG